MTNIRGTSNSVSKKDAGRISSSRRQAFDSYLEEKIDSEEELERELLCLLQQKREKRKQELADKIIKVKQDLTRSSSGNNTEEIGDSRHKITASKSLRTKTTTNLPLKERRQITSLPEGLGDRFQEQGYMGEEKEVVSQRESTDEKSEIKGRYLINLIV